MSREQGIQNIVTAIQLQEQAYKSNPELFQQIKNVLVLQRMRNTINEEFDEACSLSGEDLVQTQENEKTLSLLNKMIPRLWDYIRERKVPKFDREERALWFNTQRIIYEQYIELKTWEKIDNPQYAEELKALDWMKEVLF